MLAISVAPYTPQTTQAIASAEQVFARLVADTPESLGTGENEVLLMAFGSLVMEHFRAILMLARSQMATGSALALFRPLVDAISRGQWLYLCASPQQVESFMKRELDLSSIGFKNMSDAVDAAVGKGVWLASFHGVYKGMCDYAHTGHDAVSCRLAKDGGIEPTYPEEPCSHSGYHCGSHHSSPLHHGLRAYRPRTVSDKADSGIRAASQ